MHWFESQIGELISLADQYAEHCLARQDGPTRYDDKLETRRSEFVAALNNIVENVAMHEGVSACLISCDGLVMAMAGEAPDFDALAAVTQESVQTATKGSKMLKLGDVQQMVIVGTVHKIAIVTIDALALCVLCPKSTTLSASLRERA